MAEPTVIAQAVYLLCAVTSVACAGLLVRTYLRSHVRLTLWTALCFVGLALNNVFLFLDLVVFPGADLGGWRAATALGAMAVLVFGLVWESR
jgi:hypothetical protein